MLMVALVLWVFDLLASLELLAFRHEMGGGGAITSPCELVVCYHGKHHKPLHQNVHLHFFAL